MRIYCPACGSQVTFPADDPVKRARKVRAWVLHVWDYIRSIWGTLQDVYRAEGGLRP